MSGKNTVYEENYKCSFCGKNQHEVGRLVAGPDGVFICDQCIIFCRQMVEDVLVESPTPKEYPVPNLVDPKTLHKFLNEYVIGQRNAKQVLSVAVYNHYKRLSAANDDNTIEIQKSNILLVGPTGTGKTLLAQTLAKQLQVPFSIVDATCFTEAGYVGEDVENILLRLIQVADYDVGRAERGIIYVDEIDKITKKSPNPSITRDVSGEGVQQALLKIVEGSVVNVPPQGGRKHPQQEYIQINTQDILFICGGAFDGLDKITEERIAKGKSRLGYKPTKALDDEKWDPSSSVNAQDLIKYGFIPEFVGRLSIVVGLNELDVNDLVAILKEPKNAVVKQYQSLFKMDGVDLVFTEGAIACVAEKSLLWQTGARGLRSIIEGCLLDAMYIIPSLKNVTKCVVNASVIMGNERPLLIGRSGKVIEIELPTKESA